MRMRIRPQRGQVMLEMAISLVGLVMLSYVTLKVWSWLTTMIPQRQASFQATRLAAGKVATAGMPVPYQPPKLQLVGAAGETPGSTGGPGSIPPAPECSNRNRYYREAAALSGEGDGLMAEANEQWALVEQLRQEAEALEQERQQLQADEAAMRNDLAALDQQIPDLEAQIADLDRQIAELEGQVGDPGDVEGQIRDLEAQIRDLDAQIADLERQIGNLGDIERQIRDLERQIGDLNAQIDDLNARIDALPEDDPEREALIEERDRPGGPVESRDQLVRMLDELRGRLPGDLAGRLADARARRDDLARQIGDLRNQQGLAGQLADLRRRRNDLARQLDEARDRRTSLEGQLSANLERQAAIEARLEEIVGEIEAARTRAQSLTEQAADLYERARDLIERALRETSC